MPFNNIIYINLLYEYVTFDIIEIDRYYYILLVTIDTLPDRFYEKKCGSKLLFYDTLMINDPKCMLYDCVDR